MKLEYFILGVLKLRPQTGYDLKHMLDTEGIYLRPSTPLSQVYTTLKHMTARGWLAFIEETREGKPDLKIYSVTPAGFQALVDFLCAPHVPSIRYQDREFLGILAFSCLIEPEITLKHCYTELEYRRKQIAKNRNRDLTVRIDPSAGVPAVEAQFLFHQLDAYGRGAIEQYVAWLESFIHQFENRIQKQ